MAEWKKVLVQGADITVNSITLGSTAVTSTAAELNLLDGVSGLVQADFTKLAAVDASAAEINVLDGVTAGTVAASKGLVVDSNKDLGTLRNVIVTELSGSAISGSFFGDGSNLTGVAAGSIDIDNFTELDATPHATQDEFLISDNGTEKRVSMTNVANGAFALVSGDATIAAGGALTIEAGAVENSMLADDAVGADELAANAVVNASIASNAAIDMDKLDGDSLATAVTDFAQDDLVILSDTSDSGNLVKITTSNFEDAIFGNVSGDVTIAGGGAATLAGAQTNITSLINSSLTKIGTAADQEYVDFSTSNEVNVKINNTERLSVTATGVDITGNATVSSDLTVSGNLTVAGTTTEVQTANLNVEDKFILLNSGSSTATDESGIIFGGSGGTALTGSALIWNGDYNSNDGRAAIAHTVAGSSTTATVAYYVGGVFDGNSSDAATAKADHRGNIRVDSSNDIYIYV
jgi:hypothetical protein